MPMTTTRGAAIANMPRDPPGDNHKRSSYELIKKLTYDDLWRSSGTLVRNSLMRIDMQGATQSAHNIQVQINGIPGHSSIGHVLVAKTLKVDDKKNQTGVLRLVKKALGKSVADGRTYKVDGSIP